MRKKKKSKAKSTTLAKVLKLIGFIAIVCGIGGGIIEMVLGLHQDIHQAKGLKLTGKLWPEWLQIIGWFIEIVTEAIINLIKVLTESPLWLSLIVIGIILCLMGVFLPKESVDNT